MLRVILAISLFMAGAATAGRAQAVDRPVLLTHGRQQALPFHSLANASVGNVNVIYIQSMKPGEVVIFGAGVGESFLEITERDGRRKRLAVRVVPAQSSETRTAPQTAPEVTAAAEGAVHESVPKPDIPSRASATNGAAPEAVSSGAQASAAAAKTLSPTEGAASAPAPSKLRESPAARPSLLSRLEISADTVYQSDREQVRLVSAELMDVKKLKEVVAASAADRLATNSQREQTITLRRSAVTTALSVSYDINTRNTLTVTVPFVRRQDEILVGNGSIKTSGRGLGDVQIRFVRSYPRLFKTAWDGTAEFNVGLPTGRSVYDDGENQSPLGIGHYEVGGVAGVRRVFDPFIFNASVGLSHTLPRSVGGTRVTPGLGYSAQTGFGYALSDRWVLSEQLGYTRRPNVFLSSAADAQTVSVDQSYLSHGLVYMPRSGHSLRLMFNLGLSPASMDRGFGFTYAYRRKGRTQE